MENPAPLLLALDTATSGCSVALWRAGETLARRAEVMPRGQSEALLPMVKAVMQETGLTFDAVDRLVVTVGPGAFTGLRIGLAAARGLALAMNRPIVPVTTTEAVAQGVPPAERRGRSVVVILDSKRADFFVQCFDPALTPLGEPAALAPEALADGLPAGPLLLVGDGVDKAGAHLPGRDVRVSTAASLPDPAHMAALAADREAVSHPTPLYLRPPDAKLPKDGGRLRP
ncbi:tRNA (adenosine(37)-N6)-threonylcarbamoyltransferase complex dimerization subunit type 1 TsaB [Magnetospira sp. QH-2]|uniref:tRNA (adenosine(37)-N6)-threonylcarbamoyltransferase complex dimerization subunit type 1 TsaB n=1 Tax=Magnetospira sp. (strain QH-2) TaxID=1288970 RepID=UPI0003E81650|nr:tRNA (adenosine(37)-N6)-threonylcarbamoyltransferase complex dimerization subunit type 1 TsaB [Magnetospira sp. QH-2]CCQ75704.1 putative Peptidase M22, glycoprotease [Magnetospira sp. QH-2]